MITPVAARCRDRGDPYRESPSSIMLMRKMCAQQTLMRVESPVISEDICDEIYAFELCIHAYAYFACGLVCERSARSVHALSA